MVQLKNSDRMVRPALRSSTLRKIKKRIPGGALITHYFKRKPSPAKCGMCGKPLHGVPRERPSKMRNLPKTKKRPERPYGGVLCSSCMRKVLKEKLKKE